MYMYKYNLTVLIEKDKLNFITQYACKINTSPLLLLSSPRKIFRTKCYSETKQIRKYCNICGPGIY